MLRIKCLGQLSALRDDGQPLAGAASQPRRLPILATRGQRRAMTRVLNDLERWNDAHDLPVAV